SEIGERRAVLLEVEELGARDRELGIRSHERPERADVHHALGIWVWQRAQYHAIEEREDRRCSAESERQRHASDHGEQRRAPQRGGGVPHLAAQRVEKFGALAVSHSRLVDGPGLLPIRVVVAETPACLGFGLFACHATLMELADALLEVKAQLVVERALHAGASERELKEAAESAPAFAHLTAIPPRRVRTRRPPSSATTSTAPRWA